MATSKNFFGLRRGSTKSHTYQVFRGQQVTKDRVYDIKNPQSAAQMQQRLKVPLVAAARSVFKDLVNHSFEGISYGEDSLKNFSSINLAKGNLTVREWVPKGMMDTGLADFQMSNGSLTVPGKYTLGTGDSNSHFAAATSLKDQENALSIVGNNLTDFIANDGDTINQDILNTLCTSLGISENGQMTYIFGYRGDEYEFDSGVEGSTNIGHYHRYVIGRVINDLDKMQDWKFYGNVTADTEIVYITDGYLMIAIQNGNILIGIAHEYKEKAQIETYCIIYSELSNNVWKRSKSRMQIFSTSENPSWLDATQDYNDVLYSYLNKSSVSGSTKYLNTGADSAGVSGS